MGDHQALEIRYLGVVTPTPTNPGLHNSVRIVNMNWQGGTAPKLHYDLGGSQAPILLPIKRWTL